MWIAGSLAWGVAPGTESTPVMWQLLSSTELPQHTALLPSQSCTSILRDSQLKSVHKENSALLPVPTRGIISQLFQDSSFWVGLSLLRVIFGRSVSKASLCRVRGRFCQPAGLCSPLGSSCLHLQTTQLQWQVQSLGQSWNAFLASFSCQGRD